MTKAKKKAGNRGTKKARKVRRRRPPVKLAFVPDIAPEIGEAQAAVLCARVDEALANMEKQKPQHVEVEGVTVYHQLEEMNEKALGATLAGFSEGMIDSLVFQFQVTDKKTGETRTVRKLSLLGIETCTLLLGAVACPIEKLIVTEGEDDWYADAQAIDLRTGASRIGSGSCRKYRGQRFNRFARRTAIHIAQRNAEGKLIPRALIEHLVQRAVELGRVTIIDNPAWDDGEDPGYRRGGQKRIGYERETQGRNEDDASDRAPRHSPSRITKDDAALTARKAFFAEWAKTWGACIPKQYAHLADDHELGEMALKAFVRKATDGNATSLAVLDAASLDAVTKGLKRKRQAILGYFRSRIRRPRRNTARSSGARKPSTRRQERRSHDDFRQGRSDVRDSVVGKWAAVDSLQAGVLRPQGQVGGVQAAPVRVPRHHGWLHLHPPR
jgi:hypothetical protein